MTQPRVISHREREALRIIVRMAIDQLMSARASAASTAPASSTANTTTSSTQEAA